MALPGDPVALPGDPRDPAPRRGIQIHDAQRFLGKRFVSALAAGLHGLAGRFWPKRDQWGWISFGSFRTQVASGQDDPPMETQLTKSFLD